MDNHKNPFPIFTTLLLTGICSCVPDDGELPIDEEFDMIDAVSPNDVSRPDSSEQPGLGGVNANEPEAVEVLNDQRQADFNGDGYADLAIGAPYDEESGVASGSVNVIYGSATGLRTEGLTAEDNQIWYHGKPGLGGTPNDGDEFGWALAAGDFNGDNFADLAIGAPGDDVGAALDAGTVTILYGSATGLTAVGSLIGDQDDLPSSLGGAEAGDNFGYALTTGNFNGDTADDLAIGVPNEDIVPSVGPTVVDAGAVDVVYGTFGVGLTGAGSQFFYQGSNLTAGGETAETGDRVGRALAAGDFDDDGHDDLAIGVPEEDRTAIDDGVVHIVYGSPTTGLESMLAVVGTPDQQLAHQSFLLSDGAESGDEFGSALATGDFDNNGAHDLAIGVPLEDVNGKADAGAVNVVYGSLDQEVGLKVAGNQFWHQDVPGVAGGTDADDMFGGALAAGNFNGDTRDDLAIGCPTEDLGSDTDAGAVNVIYGRSNATGLGVSGDQRWNQDTSGILDSAEDDDSFGFALAAGDFDNDGATDLAIGVPYEGLQGGIDEAGAVNVLYGEEGDGLDDPRDQLWHQNRSDAFGDVIGVAEEGEYFGFALR